MAYSVKYINQTRKNKYGNKSQMYGGNRYDSIKEANYAMDLDWRLKAKEIKSWTRQVKLDLKVNGKHITNYYPDFIVTHVDGEIEVIDVKSTATMTDAFKLKWAILEATILDHFPEGAKMTIAV